MLPIQAVSQDVAEKMALQSIEGFKRSDTKVSYIFVCFCAKPLLEFRQCSKVRMSESKYAHKRTKIMNIPAVSVSATTHPEASGSKQMKIRSVVALLALAITSALPTFAQGQKAVDPEVRKQIETVFAQFQEAYNKHDAAAMAALHTQTAVEVRSWQGLATGREAIVKRLESDFARNPGKMVNELVEVYPVGNDICAIFDTTVGGQKGHAVTIYVREGDGWKIRMTYLRL